MWWCPELGTTLANEEVVEGRSEVGGFACERRPLRQWMLKITDYAERLLDGLNELDWPESTLEMQRNWIGKSVGSEIEFELIGRKESVQVFTTRPDTLFGATFLALSPEHPLTGRIATSERRDAVQRYCREAAHKSQVKRVADAHDRSGVDTGARARHPATGKEVPVWVADYVLMGYGTGAIMGVPGEDQRDWEFAHEHSLPVVRTVQPPEGHEDGAWTGEGVAINSDFLNGLGMEAAKQTAIDWLERRGRGRARTAYRLRDWLFSRQRYWGEPFSGGVRGRRGETAARIRTAADPAGAGGLSSQWFARRAAGKGRRMVERPGPGKRPAGAPRNQHDAAVGRFLLVLPALYRSAQPRPPGGLGAGALLDAGRSLHWRRRTCGSAPALRKVLAQGPVRRRAGVRR